ncbi:unnamed protein product [Angiostrongylus costaricensis]|uniref:NYAP_N domain-containing protein n=1 Tax=Angiostrongylus costaricensis TaxID=334426 RepID=A0A0R3PNR0_ANGCS|nr:unnamed protein product [Angiostrongylus costaricensis]
MEEFEDFPPTCSSSDDHDRVSPRHEPTFPPQSTERLDPGPVPCGLPPRAPMRNTPVTASLRSYAVPPPYSACNKQKPPPYPGRAHSGSPCSTPLPASFVPQSSSTPKSSDESPSRKESVNKPPDQVVAEGERRTFIREKEERLDKAMSIYENVSQAEVRANESTVWYEYGCV